MNEHDVDTYLYESLTAEKCRDLFLRYTATVRLRSHRREFARSHNLDQSRTFEARLFASETTVTDSVSADMVRKCVNRVFAEASATQTARDLNYSVHIAYGDKQRATRSHFQALLNAAPQERPSLRAEILSLRDPESVWSAAREVYSRHGGERVMILAAELMRDFGLVAGDVLTKIVTEREPASDYFADAIVDMEGMPTPKKTTLIAILASDSRTYVREAALHAAIRLPTSDAKTILRTLSADSDGQVAEQAIEASEKLTDKV